jgi:hypothetical protein
VYFSPGSLEADMGRNPETVLLDSADLSDAFSTGRDGVEDIDHGEPGLRIRYESGPFPQLTIQGDHGEVSLAGAAEIFWVTQSLKLATAWACRDAKAKP